MESVVAFVAEKITMPLLVCWSNSGSGLQSNIAIIARSLLENSTRLERTSARSPRILCDSMMQRRSIPVKFRARISLQISTQPSLQ